MSPAAAHKVLTDQLRVLQHVGIIHREAKARTYRRVHYDLTEAGQRFVARASRDELAIEIAERRLESDQVRAHVIDHQHARPHVCPDKRV